MGFVKEWRKNKRRKALNVYRRGEFMIRTAMIALEEIEEASQQTK